jgi:hypothetical protein
MKNGGSGGVSGKAGWVMSPTSYRAAPPRTECDRGNLLHSTNPGKGLVSLGVYSVHGAHTAWDQNWDQATSADQGIPLKGSSLIPRGAMRLEGWNSPLGQINSAGGWPAPGPTGQLDCPSIEAVGPLHFMPGLVGGLTPAGRIPGHPFGEAAGWLLPAQEQTEGSRSRLPLLLGASSRPHLGVKNA